MNSLEGKTILFLGSSVTEGSAAGGYSFADALAEHDHIKMYKEAVGGTTLAGDSDSSYTARMKRGHLPPDVPADALICQLSTNDASQGFPIASVESAIREVVRYTRATWGCPVYFYTGTKFDSAAYAEMVGLLHRLAGELEFEILDLWSDPEMLAVSADDYASYMADPIHPTREGYIRWWYPKFRAFLQERL